MNTKREKKLKPGKEGGVRHPEALVCGMAGILMVGIECGIKAWGLPYNRRHVNKSSKAEHGIVWSKNSVYMWMAWWAMLWLWWENIDLALLLSSVGKKNEVLLCTWLRQDQLMKKESIDQESSWSLIPRAGQSRREFVFCHRETPPDGNLGCSIRCHKRWGNNWINTTKGSFKEHLRARFACGTR